MALTYDGGQIVFDGPIAGWSTADGDGGAAGPVKTANANYDGSGALNKILTAGANGALARRARFAAVGENVQSVARIFLHDGSTGWVLIHEVTLPATPAANNAARPVVIVPLDLMMQPGHELHFTIGTTVAGGYYGSAEGMDAA